MLFIQSGGFQFIKEFNSTSLSGHLAFNNPPPLYRVFRNSPYLPWHLSFWYYLVILKEVAIIKAHQLFLFRCTLSSLNNLFRSLLTILIYQLFSYPLLINCDYLALLLNTIHSLFLSSSENAEKNKVLLSSTSLLSLVLVILFPVPDFPRMLSHVAYIYTVCKT